MQNVEEIQFWNAKPGEAWTRHQDSLDRLFGNVGSRLVDIAGPTSGMSVLEVGCGTGDLALHLSERVGSSGHVDAIDVSEPMLDLARQRAAIASRTNVNHLLADAQIYDFASSQYDLVVSRFGVMFFDDPTAAFKNMLGSIKPKGRTVFAAWSSMADNPWFTIPRDAAIDRLGKPSPQPPMAPGPTAFADLGYVSGILEQAGYAKVNTHIEEVMLDVLGNERDAATLGCEIGPVSRIAKEKSASESDLAAIQDEVTNQFKQYVSGSQVLVPAKIIFVECLSV